MAKEINLKERMFIEAYTGDPVEAMRIAGYGGDNASLTKLGNALLSRPDITQAIRERSKYMSNMKKTIMDRQELQEMWSNLARNEDPYHKEELDSNGIPLPPGNIPLMTRLKATEYIAKSEAIFVDKVDMKTNMTITDIISQSYKLGEDDRPLEDIEADYYLLQEKRLLKNEEPKSLEDLV